MSSFSSFEKDKERFDVWRGFLLAEELKPCGDSALTFDQFVTAIEYASMDAQKRVQKREELEKTGKLNKTLTDIFTVAGIVAGFPFMGAIASLTVGAAVVGAIAGLFRMKQKSKADEKINQLLEMLCIDPELLVLIDNKLENEYLKSPDFQKELEDFVIQARSDDGVDSMRDFSQHLMDWLNTRSEYAKSDRTNVVPTK
jgi:hypothetical protein